MLKTLGPQREKAKPVAIEELDEISEHESESLEPVVSDSEVKPVEKKKRVQPRKYRGAVGGIRLQQTQRKPVFKRTTLFNIVQHIMRKELDKQEMKIKRESVYLLATALERLLLDEAMLANRLALMNGNKTLKLQYSQLATMLSSETRPSNWSEERFDECDDLLVPSQFRNTQIDE